MKKFIPFLSLILCASVAFAYTPVSRQRNFVNDANNSIPITASYMDAEFDNLITAANGTLIAQGSTPTSPFEGEFWYDTTNHVLKFYRNNEWILVNPIHSGSVMATPQKNDFWINNVLGQNHIKLYDGVNWNDIPIVPKLNGVNWQVPIFNGVNWQDLIINKGINWSSTTPILFNGVNWDDPSYSPGASKVWQYQSFGNVPIWTSGLHSQVFTSSGTFTAPSGFTKVYLTGCAGGAGGKTGAAGPQCGAGGGAGQCVVNYPYTVVGGNSYTVTIGAGGATDAGGNSTVFDGLTLGAGHLGSSFTGGIGYNNNGGNSTGGGFGVVSGSGGNGDVSCTSQGGGGGTIFGAGANTGSSATANTGAGGAGGNASAGTSGGSGIMIVQW